MPYPNNYICVVGAGAWGTTLSALLADKGYDVTLWAYEQEVVNSINQNHENEIYLPGEKLPYNLVASLDLAQAVHQCRVLISAVPTQFIRKIFSPIASYISKDTIIISASKGIDINTLKTPSVTLSEILGRDVAVLSGPSFAKEVIAKKPTAVTLAIAHKQYALFTQDIFTTDYFRVYTHDDIIGVELGGALKNVIAIASGICDGLELGLDARAALITRGLSEITRLGIRLGAQERTFAGLSGLGDLVLTCTGALSRNYTVGQKLGRGMKLEEITSETKSIAEGVATTLATYKLAKLYKVEMPITEQVYLTLYEDKPPQLAVRDLMTRTLKSEFY